MGNQYDSVLNARKYVPQTESMDDNQVQNNAGAPLLTEEHAAPGGYSYWSLANAIADKIAEMGLNGKKLSMKQLRYIKYCILQGKTVTLADVMSV